MNNQVQAIKGAFFDLINKCNDYCSVIDLNNELVKVLKRELAMGHVAFYSLSPHTKSFPFQMFLHNFKPGQAIWNQKDVLLPIYCDEDMCGVIELREFDSTMSVDLHEVAKACSEFYTYYIHSFQLREKEQKYEKLYYLTEKFHSLMNKDDVLVALIETLQKMYQKYTFYLFLSHDNENKHHLPIKNLSFDDQDDEMAMEAFVTGKAQSIIHEQTKDMFFYSPLKGKQGVYGVLQVVIHFALNLHEQDRHFITLLTNAAGTAMENAQLYDQSKRLIKDLQLINETSHRLNKNLRLTDTMSYMSMRILESFQADEVGFFTKNSNDIHIFPGSTSYFESEEVKVYINYIQEKLEKDLEGLFLGDITSYLPGLPYSSVMAVPMVQSDMLKGCALVLHKNPYHFSFDMYKLLQSLIHHSTLALSNSLLREELETLVKTDQLTQLYSRNYMNSCIENSMNIDRQGTFVLIDIDNFKAINDNYGHQIGDEVLVQVANILKNNIRDHDIGARWGGEELAIYLPHVELDAGTAIAERIVKRVKENTLPTVTISCGVSHWKAEHERNYDELFRRADKALYAAKNLGKNQVIVQVS
ncbi:sensor domain-containing diguanylate cyclase [Metabacillus halosaccharovorans]|uniref:sensor domain-containing diguanylate cyclase n=1 Tax=Metabacillus halosaccharovorans TaxID=930124 RepID=UPI0020A8000A|nr:diguanylate cyclase [Metabacillus halosaccharovorans]